MKFTLFISFWFITIFVYGQTNNDNIILWSSTKKLRLEDFEIKTANNETSTSFVQFSLDYKINGFDFLTKNFNKKVLNYCIKSASWIDTTNVNIQQSIRYQQTLFDICEIYARQFRQKLKENRKKIAFGTQFIESMSQSIMTDFSKRRVKYDLESSFGTFEIKQREWEFQIKKELEGLKDFSSE